VLPLLLLLSLLTLLELSFRGRSLLPELPEPLPQLLDLVLAPQVVGRVVEHVGLDLLQLRLQVAQELFLRR
jgi:hypothetical protein